jgi:hypothetical protein
MRIIPTLLIVIFLSACVNKKEKNFSDLDKLNLITDSLLNLLQVNYDNTSENLYYISDDSLKRDSLIQVLNLPDSMGYYQYMEHSLNQLNEIVFQTQQEIYFAKDQLNSLKMEYENNDISESEYSDEVSDLYKIVQFLEERVDSNIYLIKKKYHYNTAINDSVN